MTVLYVLTAAISLLVLLLFGAVIELHRQVLQLRMYVGLVDTTQALEFNSEVMWSDLPIPAATYPIEASDRSAVLILSDSCTTCVEVADHLAAGFPPRLLAVVEARSHADALHWLAARGLQHGEQLVYDDGGGIAELLGVKATPAVVKFHGRSPIAAATVPSARQLDLINDWLNNLEPLRKIESG
jgi:hypothetical protein